MARQRWFADGWEISGVTARDVETYSGLFTSPGLEGANTPNGQRDGVGYVPKNLGVGGFTMRMWMGGSTREAVEADWERLLAAVVKPRRLVKWAHHRADGTVRECYGEVTGRVSPTPVGQLGMRASLDVAIPSGVWQDPTGSDTGPIPLLTSGNLVAVNRTVDLPAFRGATAPLTGLTVEVRGFARGVRVTDPVTGAWFTYDADLPAGVAVTVNALDDDAAAPLLDDFRYRGPYMAEVTPPDDPGAAPTLVVAATQAGSEATIRVTGRRYYLVE